MAQRYTLVPSSFGQGKLSSERAWTSEAAHPTSVPQPKSLVVEEEDRTESPLETVLSLLPKRLKNKGKILAHYLKGKVNLDSNNRVIYSDNSLGSHLLDLIRYYTTSSGINISRPIDALQFGLLLKKLGVPDAALGRPITLKRILKSGTVTNQQRTKSVKNGDPRNRSGTKPSRITKGSSSKRFAWRSL